MAQELASLAGGVVNQAVDYSFQKALNAENQAYYRANQQRNFQLSMLAQRQAPSNMVQGYKMAGLSPALASNGNFAPAGMSPAPLASSHVNASGVNPVDAVLSAKQAHLLDAQAENVEANTESTEIQNTREHTADEQFVEAMKENLEDSIHIYNELGLDSSSLQASYDAISSGEMKVNLGTFKANMQALELSSKSMDGYLQKLQNVTNQLIEVHKLDNGVAKDIALMPKVERELEEKKIALTLAQTYYMTQSGDEAKANIKKIGEEIKKFNAEIDLMAKEGRLTDAKANQIRNQDVNTLIGDGGTLGKALEGLELFGALKPFTILDGLGIAPPTREPKAMPAPTPKPWETLLIPSVVIAVKALPISPSPIKVLTS